MAESGRRTQHVAAVVRLLDAEPGRVLGAVVGAAARPQVGGVGRTERPGDPVVEVALGRRRIAAGPEAGALLGDHVLPDRPGGLVALRGQLDQVTCLVGRHPVPGAARLERDHPGQRSRHDRVAGQHARLVGEAHDCLDRER